MLCRTQPKFAFLTTFREKRLARIHELLISRASLGLWVNEMNSHMGQIFASKMRLKHIFDL